MSAWAVAASCSQAALALNRPGQVRQRAVEQVGEELLDDGVTAVGFGLGELKGAVGEHRVNGRR